MSEGVVLAALANSLKNKRCSLQNEVSLERTIQGVRFKTPKYNCSFSCVITNF